MESLEKEVWYPVNKLSTFEAFDYSISNFGNLKNNKTGMFLQTLVTNSSGYITTILSNKKQRKSIDLHKLVALAFIPNPDDLPEINHKDGDKTNNRANNLEWCTHQYNIDYGSRTSRQKNSMKGRHSSKNTEFTSESTLGAKNPRSRKIVQLDKDRKFVREYEFIKQAETYGFNPVCITDVCRGKCKTHKNQIFMYKEDYERSLKCQ